METCLSFRKERIIDVSGWEGQERWVLEHRCRGTSSVSSQILVVHFSLSVTFSPPSLLATCTFVRRKEEKGRLGDSVG